MSRAQAVDAADLLNDVVGDLVAGTNVLREWYAAMTRGAADEGQVVAVQKMCVSHLMLTCSKLIEIYEKYNRVIPEPSRGQLKALMREFNRREIPAFRNKVAGHIWDKQAGRPLTQSEVTARLEVICSPDMPTFLTWLNDLTGNKSPENVVAVAEEARDALVQVFGLTPGEIVQR